MPSLNQPYSQRGLEQLATALGVNKAQIWHDPQYHRLAIRDIKPVPEEHPEDEMSEDEE